MGIIGTAKQFVQQEIGNDATGHDWWHSYRVLKNALLLSEGEDVDIEVVQLAALLHDLDDEKVRDGNLVAPWLKKNNVANATHILDIINTLSFSHGLKMKTREGMIVQDADKLEAMGAIGIARTFAMGHKVGQLIYDPAIKPREGISKEEYRKMYTGEYKNTTINHFYEKLFKLKDLMNTEKGREIAERREQFMKDYLEEFYAEWDGKR